MQSSSTCIYCYFNTCAISERNFLKYSQHALEIHVVCLALNYFIQFSSVSPMYIVIHPKHYAYSNIVTFLCRYYTFRSLSCSIVTIAHHSIAITVSIKVAFPLTSNLYSNQMRLSVTKVVLLSVISRQDRSKQSIL